MTAKPETQWTAHAAAAMFPLLQGEEFEALKRDIEKNGQRVPILWHKGQVLDGRNRMRACLELGIEPIVEDVTGDVDPFVVVVSANLYRRHLTFHERGAIIKAVLEARGVRRGKGSSAAKRHSQSATVADIASELGIPERTMRRTIKASDDYDDYDALPPGAKAEVDSGETTLAKLQQAAKKPKVAEEPIGTAVVDPAEHYGDNGRVVDNPAPAEPKPPRKYTNVDRAIGDLLEALHRYYDRWPEGELGLFKAITNQFLEGMGNV